MGNSRTVVPLSILILIALLGLTFSVGYVGSKFNQEPRHLIERIKGVESQVQAKLTTTPGQKLDKLAKIVERIDFSVSHGPVETWLLEQIEDSEKAKIAVSAQGIVIAWSRGAEQLFGFNREESVGYGIGVILPKDSRPHHREAFDAAMGGGKIRTSTVVSTAMTSTGEMIEVSIKTSAYPERMAIATIERVEK